MPALKHPSLRIGRAGVVSRDTRADADRATPDRLIAYVHHLDDMAVAQYLAERSCALAKIAAPKLTGESSGHFIPVWGRGWYGVVWLDRYVWFQEAGARPFVMRKLAGKTIPMWIDDPTGEERRKNPRAKVRSMHGGRVQVLIFRRAAKKGERKVVRRRVGGQLTRVDVPRSYPGAPGRINRRQPAAPDTLFNVGKGGQIAPTNIGVRWRHPGLMSKDFVRQGLVTAALESKVSIRMIVPLNPHAVVG